MPEVERTEDSTHSLIDVDSPHISSVPSDFDVQSVKTDTQAERQEREAEDAERQEQQQQQQQKSAEAKKKAAAAKEKAKKEAGIAGKRVRDNAGNPVVLGNAIVVGILGTVLGVKAYQTYAKGQLSWGVVGAWVGVVGVFATADYYVSK